MVLRIPNSRLILLLKPAPSLSFQNRGIGILSAFTQDLIKINIRRTLPYTAQSLYPLIADIDSYSQFLPYCTGSIVTQRDATNSPINADLQVGWDAWSETFSSRVSCLKDSIVTAEASGHPLFQHLKATWILSPQEKQGMTTVSLGVEYNFSNPLYNNLARQFAPKIAEKLVRAFEARAKQELDGM